MRVSTDYDETEMKLSQFCLHTHYDEPMVSIVFASPDAPCSGTEHRYMITLERLDEMVAEFQGEPGYAVAIADIRLKVLVKEECSCPNRAVNDFCQRCEEIESLGFSSADYQTT